MSAPGRCRKAFGKPPTRLSRRSMTWAPNPLSGCKRQAGMRWMQPEGRKRVRGYFASKRLRSNCDNASASARTGSRVLLWEEEDMSRGMPSLTALLGLLAIAGYQNRDKLAEMLNGTGSAASSRPGGQQPQAGLGGLLSNLTGMVGGAGVGGLLNGGLGELLERFKQNGQGD